MNVAVVGRGAVGTTLARALCAAGAEVRRVPGRDLRPEALGDADVVLLAIPDAALADAAARLAQAKPRRVILHVAGARTPAELASARSGGHAVGAMHPLVSFADRKHPPGLANATFVIAGDTRAIAAASRIAERVGARALVAEVHGPAYHAAAAMVANGAAALAHAGADLLMALGCDRVDAEIALAGLLRSVASNVASVGVPAALTGPIVRGDAETVARHRAAVEGVDPALRVVYDAAARAIVRCAVDAGLERGRADRVIDALSSEIELEKKKGRR